MHRDYRAAITNAAGVDRWRRNQQSLRSGLRELDPSHTSLDLQEAACKKYWPHERKSIWTQLSLLSPFEHRWSNDHRNEIFQVSSRLSGSEYMDSARGISRSPFHCAHDTQDGRHDLLTARCLGGRMEMRAAPSIPQSSYRC